MVAGAITATFIAAFVTKTNFDTLISEAADDNNIPASWLRAICRQESGFNPEAKLLTGTDGRRGGAWGMCQMTFRTAQGLGYAGPPDGLLDPATNLGLAARLLAQLKARYGNLRDVAACYNSGRSFSRAKQLACSPDTRPEVASLLHHTVDTYVPNVLRYEVDEREG